MKRTKFTTIYHLPRLKLGLTCNEYCLVDIIYHLSNKKRTEVKDWCYAKKQTLADMLGISKRSIITLIKKLETKGLLKCSPDRKFVQTTQLWETEVIDYNYGGEESSPTVKKVHTIKGEESSQGVKKVHLKGEESSPPSNRDTNRDNNKDNNNGKNLPIPSFSEFWNLYDYKKNKATAEKSWLKLTNLEKMRAIEAIPQYLVFLAKNNHPQCHASTWLNQKRWEDDNSIKGQKVKKQPSTLFDTSTLNENRSHLFFRTFETIYSHKRERELVKDHKYTFHESGQIIRKEIMDIERPAAQNDNYRGLLLDLANKYPELYKKTQIAYQQKYVRA